MTSSGLPTFGHRGVGFQFGRTSHMRVSSTPPPMSPTRATGPGIPYGSVSAVTDPQRRGRERDRDRERLLSGRPLLMRLDKDHKRLQTGTNGWIIQRIALRLWKDSNGPMDKHLGLRLGISHELRAQPSRSLRIFQGIRSMSSHR